MHHELVVLLDNFNVCFKQRFARWNFNKFRGKELHQYTSWINSQTIISKTLYLATCMQTFTILVALKHVFQKKYISEADVASGWNRHLYGLRGKMFPLLWWHQLELCSTPHLWRQTACGSKANWLNLGVNILQSSANPYSFRLNALFFICVCDNSEMLTASDLSGKRLTIWLSKKKKNWSEASSVQN